MGKYQNNQLEAYYTEEGRINYAQSSRHEYNIKDHLGNTRVCFTPNPSNPTSTLPKILQQTNYYAYGLPIGNLSRTYPLSGVTPLEEKYQYNGIELTNDFGLMINEARYRTLDPQLGRWWQIDPEVEQFEAWSAYNSNLDNPIRYEDKNGDTPITVGPAVAAGVVAFIVDTGFQVGKNLYNDKPAFYKYSLSSSVISGGAAFGTVLTGGLVLGASATAGQTVVVGATTGGLFGAGESAAKQYVENGSIDPSKTIADGFVSTVTAGYGESGQQMFGMFTKGETIEKAGQYAKDAMFNTVGEVTENTGQGIADEVRERNQTSSSTKTQGNTKAAPASKPLQRGSYGTKVGDRYSVAPLQ